MVERIIGISAFLGRLLRPWTAERVSRRCALARGGISESRIEISRNIRFLGISELFECVREGRIAEGTARGARPFGRGERGSGCPRRPCCHQ